MIDFLLCVLLVVAIFGGIYFTLVILPLKRAVGFEILKSQRAEAQTKDLYECPAYLNKEVYIDLECMIRDYLYSKLLEKSLGTKAVIGTDEDEYDHQLYQARIKSRFITTARRYASNVSPKKLWKKMMNKKYELKGEDEL